MSTETTWISLSERKPTAEDADENGRVWVNIPRYDRAKLSHYLNTSPEAVAFHPIPKRVVPPLPKPVEKTQRELDREKYIELAYRKTDMEEDILDAMQWARAEERAKHLSSIAAERKRFAAQCLRECDCLRHVATYVEEQSFETFPEKLRALHKLLTEAAR